MGHLGGSFGGEVGFDDWSISSEKPSRCERLAGTASPLKTFPRPLRLRICLVLLQLGSFTAAGIADEVPDLLGTVRKRS